MSSNLVVLEKLCFAYKATVLKSQLQLLPFIHFNSLFILHGSSFLSVCLSLSLNDPENYQSRDPIKLSSTDALCQQGHTASCGQIGHSGFLKIQDLGCIVAAMALESWIGLD